MNLNIKRDFVLFPILFVYMAVSLSATIPQETEPVRHLSFYSENAPLPLTSYERDPEIPDDVWESVLPYLLPDDHPIKPKLDALFSKKRHIFNHSSLKSGKFKFKKSFKSTRIIVAKHSKLDGYLLKLFTDEQPVHQEWKEFIKRIRGADFVRQAVNEFGYEQFFVVPNKWIYPLPVHPKSTLSHNRHFVLVVEDMHILKKEDNLLEWRSKMTPAKLDAVYNIVNTEGLFDSLLPDNIPITKEGKIAIIDTQWFHHWPIRWEKLLSYLSPHMKIYWQKLIQEGGPQPQRDK